MKPGVQLRPCFFRGAHRVLPNLTIRHDAEELIHARPRDRPGMNRGGESLKKRECMDMLGNFATMRINQNVGIYRDHDQWPP